MRQLPGESSDRNDDLLITLQFISHENERWRQWAATENERWRQQGKPLKQGHHRRQLPGSCSNPWPAIQAITLIGVITIAVALIVKEFQPKAKVPHGTATVQQL